MIDFIGILTFAWTHNKFIFALAIGSIIITIIGVFAGVMSFLQSIGYIKG